jgi:hypothetical protein
MSCIGEVFQDGDYICGAIVSMRKGGNKFAIWLKGVEEKKVIQTG